MHKRLYFKSQGIIFEYNPRGTYNQISGDSASGKSFFFACLKEVAGRRTLPGIPELCEPVDAAGSLPEINDKKVMFIDYQSTDAAIDYALSLTGFVVCIDNADIINMTYLNLSEKLRNNPSNMYILAGRGFYGLFIPERDRQFPVYDELEKKFTFRFREDYI